MHTYITLSLPLPWEFNPYWINILQFGLLFFTVLIANVIRLKVKWIKKSLLPVAVLAGFLLLGLKYLLPVLNIKLGGEDIISTDFMAMVTYHMIAIGFIALAMKDKERKYQNNGVDIKQTNAFKSGLFIVSTYIIQGIVGIIITIGLGFIFDSVAKYSGILLPMGYGQGPGQANNIGLTFENAGFVGGQAFGLMIATLGFVSAAVGGVIYLVRLVKTRNRQEKFIPLDENVLSQEQTILEGNQEIPLVESADKLTVQVAIVVGIYIVTYAFLLLLNFLVELTPADGFLVKNIRPLLWGFNFLFAMIIAMGVKSLFGLLFKKGVMKRKYTNDFFMNRIAGIAFDVMIVSSIAAIDIESLNDSGLIVTLIILGILGLVVTYFYVRHITKRIYKGYENEAWLIFYGNLTGTASTGVALLRELDPHFKTPAANDLILGSSTAVLLGFPILLIVGYIYTNDNAVYISLAVLIILFVIFYLFLVDIIRFKKKK